MLRELLLIVTAGLSLGLTGTAGAAAPEEVAAPFRFPAHRIVPLENGMTVLLMERSGVPLVSVQWLLRTGGSVNDPAGKEGLAELTARMLRKGTASRSGDAISAAIDFVGGRLDARATLECAVGGGEFMGKDLDLALALLAEMLQQPTFPRGELAKLTRQGMDGIKQAKMNPPAVMGRYFSGLLMAGHPYGRPVGGTELSLAKIRRQDVVNFHRRNYAPSRLILAVVGDISAAEVEAKVRAQFGAWNTPAPAPVSIPAPARVTGRTILLVDKPDATQTFFRLGDVGLERTNPDWVAAEVVNTLFGGRFTSMLNSALRIESGLTYGARSGFAETTLPGEFGIGSFTQNDKTETALKMTLEVIAKLRQEGLTEAQLQSAKAYLKGQFGPTMETNDQLAGALCELQFYGLGMDYYDHYFRRVDAVTPADARRVIDRYFAGENFRMVLIGRLEVTEPVARGLAGEILKRDIAAPGF
jgi:predicted Zn-dependent peptidase